jgi:hypothetical protein
MPSGVHCPSCPHTRRAGPRSSKPRSQEYVATVSGPSKSSEKNTDEWAGAPGNRHPLLPAAHPAGRKAHVTLLEQDTISLQQWLQTHPSRITMEVTSLYSPLHFSSSSHRNLLTLRNLVTKLSPPAVWGQTVQFNSLFQVRKIKGDKDMKGLKRIKIGKKWVPTEFKRADSPLISKSLVTSCIDNGFR